MRSSYPDVVFFTRHCPTYRLPAPLQPLADTEMRTPPFAKQKGVEKNFWM